MNVQGAPLWDRQHFDVAQQARRGRQILVVDDNDDVRQPLASALLLIGCGVTEASNGLEALRVFRTQGADLVVTDIEMPLMDGYGLIVQLKRCSPSTPIVVITGSLLDIDPVLLNPSVAAVLYKPFSLKRLQQVVMASIGPRAFLS